MNVNNMKKSIARAKIVLVGEASYLEDLSLELQSDFDTQHFSSYEILLTELSSDQALYIIDTAALPLSKTQILKIAISKWTHNTTPIIFYQKHWSSDECSEAFKHGSLECLSSSLDLNESYLRVSRIIQLLSESSTQTNDDPYIHIFSKLHKTINNSLNDIRSITQALHKEDLSLEGKKFVDVISSSSNDIHLHLKKSLDYYEYLYRDLRIKPQVHCFPDFIAQLLKPYHERCDKQDISFLYELDSQIPKFMEFDSKHISNALHILLDNSIKNTLEGGLFVSLSLIEKTTSHASFQIKIKDTGCGIPSKVVKEIFTSPQIKFNSSSGFGLLTAKTILQNLNSELCLIDNGDQGCCFTFSLNTLLAEPPEQASFSNTYETAIPNNLQILLVGADDINKKIFSSLFTLASQHVTATNTSREALMQIHSTTFDLIALDTNIADSEATQVLYKLLAMTQIPVILLFPERDLTVPFHSFSPHWLGVNKPIIPSEFYATCSQAMTQHNPKSLSHIPYLDDSILDQLAREVSPVVLNKIIENTESLALQILKHLEPPLNINTEIVTLLSEQADNIGLPRLAKQLQILLNSNSIEAHQDTQTKIIYADCTECIKESLRSLKTFISHLNTEDRPL